MELIKILNKRQLKDKTPAYAIARTIDLVEGKTQALYYFFTQLSKPFPNYEETLKQLNIPILVIWGKYDKVLSWESQKHQVIKLLKIKVNNIHILDEIHFIQEEHPNKITTLINNFIN